MTFIFVILSLFIQLSALGAPLNALLKFYLKEKSSRVRLCEFYPEGVSRIHKASRPHMGYGVPTQRLQKRLDSIESLPVIGRLILMHKLARLKRFPPPDEYLATKYQKKLIATSLIDVRLLRLLIRFATGYLGDDERYLRTACDIIEHLREKYPDGSFDRITPVYVLDWYYGIGGTMSSLDDTRGPPFALMAVDDPRTRRNILSPNTTEQVFVYATPQIWKMMILEPLIQRLTDTGYETLI